MKKIITVIFTEKKIDDLSLINNKKQYKYVVNQPVNIGDLIYCPAYTTRMQIIDILDYDYNSKYKSIEIYNPNSTIKYLFAKDNKNSSLMETMLIMQMMGQENIFNPIKKPISNQ